MSNFFIVKSGYTPGPQPQTVTESQKAQDTLAFVSFNYVLNANAQTVTETQKAQETFAFVSFNYA